MWCDVMWCECDVMWCDVTWRDVTWRDVTWRDVTWRDVMWCDVMWCDVMWCDVMWCDVMWCDVMWCDVMWYNIIPCSSDNVSCLRFIRLLMFRSCYFSLPVSYSQWLTNKQGQTCTKTNLRFWIQSFRSTVFYLKKFYILMFSFFVT